MENIICERRVYEDRFNRHAHLYGQLIIPIEGEMLIETDAKRLHVDNNRVFFSSS